jgi:glycosyltransferase involved in cell wall biosynthesis
MELSQKVSVLIRTFNSEKTLLRLLPKLHLDEGDELLIVDSGSSDNTRKVASQFSARFVEAPLPFNYSKSLNVGFRAAKNPLVYVLSSHVVPMIPNLLGKMRHLFISLPQDVVAIYGPGGILGRDHLNLGNEPLYIFQQADFSKYQSIIGNANTIYRHSAWQKTLFDEGIRTSEDKLWARAILDFGSKLAYAPSVAVVNKSQYSLAYMFRKGQSDARADKHEDEPSMQLWQLAGALKNLFVKKFLGEIDYGNWIRCSAHAFGQYSGSRLDKDNTPRTNSFNTP